jgi:exonuclease III
MHSSLQTQHPGRPTLTTITPTHEKTITIETQNVGGIKLESERGRGPKLATLRNLVNKSTDFLVLTETRVDVCAVRKLKIKHGLKPTAFSLHRRPRGGVIIFSRLEHKLIPDSIQTSNTAGHITAAVYEVATLPTIVVGVYGHSDSSDRASLQVMGDLQSILRELTQVYETQRILVAGDFNIGMEEEDTNSGINKKPLTTALLQTLLQDYHLVDIGAQLNNKSHTWFRRDSSGQSSRIDFFL